MFTGSMPALVTPFRDGALDLKTLEALVEWQIGEGSNGLVPVGTTGGSVQWAGARGAWPNAIGIQKLGQRGNLLPPRSPLPP